MDHNTAVIQKCIVRLGELEVSWISATTKIEALTAERDAAWGRLKQLEEENAVLRRGNQSSPMGEAPRTKANGSEVRAEA